MFRLERIQIMEKPMQASTKFYEWNQNNSGGSFDVDGEITHTIYIEADSYDEAEKKALDLGVYYDGCGRGLDCYCCGDRWYEGDEVELPHYSGKETVEEVAQYVSDKYGRCKPDARIFYKDGNVKEIFSKKVK